MQINKKKVLLCAFACSPDGSSSLGTGEDILGWNVVTQVSGFSDVFVITSPKNKLSIEAELLRHSENNIHFYYDDLPRWLAKPLEAIWSQGGSELYSYFWQIKIYFLAKKLHKKIHFDVFHHVTYANDWMASFIGALLPVSYIRGPGGGAHHVPKSFLSEFSIGDHFWQKFRKVGQWIFRHDIFFLLSQKKSKAILVCNYEALENIPQKYRKKTHLFPVNGIAETDIHFLESAKKSTDIHFLESAKKSSNGIFTVISAGRLIQIKGFPLVIKAFKIFHNNFPETRLIIAGDGPELSHLQTLVSTLGIKESVVFTGWVSRESLLSSISAADVFLFGSVRDGGGAVVVEAMAAGKPVVCFDIAGPGFHVDKNCGITIKPESPEQAIKDMASALKKLYTDVHMRAELGGNAHKKVIDTYRWEKLGSRLEQIYEKIF